jgi:hypothetical protein
MTYRATKHSAFRVGHVLLRCQGHNSCQMGPFPGNEGSLRSHYLDALLILAPKKARSFCTAAPGSKAARPLIFDRIGSLTGPPPLRATLRRRKRGRRGSRFSFHRTDMLSTSNVARFNSAPSRSLNKSLLNSHRREREGHLSHLDWSPTAHPCAIYSARSRMHHPRQPTCGCRADVHTVGWIVSPRTCHLRDDCVIARQARSSVAQPIAYGVRYFPLPVQ